MIRSTDAEYFIQKAEQCFGLARNVRADPAHAEVADKLEAIAHEFLARAVEIDTERDRAEKKARQ